MDLKLKLIIEKGPREGETLTFSPDSSSLIKVGRVIRGNTLAIKESGISTKHMCIQFDNQWIVYDLNSSNLIDPHVPSVLNNGDRIKIGELTSILVIIENNELGFGGDDLGKVEKRNLRSNVNKGVDSRRTLNKDEVSLVLALEPKMTRGRKKIPDLSAEMVNVSEPRMTRGRKKKLPELDQTKPVPARTTRALPVEDNLTESLQVGDGNEDENLESNVEQQLEKMVSTQQHCQGSSKYGCYNDKWNDLEKMTVDDFFDYLEWQFAKEIYDKSEKIIGDMTDKARKYHEFRRQSGKGKN